MTTFRLSSQRHSARDPLDAMELCFDRGWTDGLPVVPPTPVRVEAFLEAANLLGDEILGTVPVRRRIVTAEKVAINAVMAGCLPEYFPVVAAAVQALCDPAFNLQASSAGLMGTAHCVVVNGPIRGEIGLNSGANCFGPGERPNAAIGRALRLVVMNVLGSRPGGLDTSCYGQPAMYTMCVGEDEEHSAWAPLHVERGVPPEMSAVTVVPTTAQYLAIDQRNPGAGAILDAIREVLLLSPFYSTVEMLVVIGGEHRKILQAEGWNKQSIRRWLYETARIPREDALIRHDFGLDVPEGEEGNVPVLRSADDLLIVCAGGDAGGWSIVHMPQPLSHAVTKSIGASLDC